MPHSCDKIEEGVVVISGEVDKDGNLISEPEVHFPGNTVLGNDRTVAETFHYADLFKRLMDECPCKLKLLIKEAKILEKTLEQA